MWTFGKKIALGFAVALALLLIIGSSSYRGVNTLSNTSLRVTHTHGVVETIARLFSAVKDAETGQRGFVITGDESFLEPYTAALTDVPDLVRALRALIVDLPDQQRRLSEAETHINVKMAELRRVIDVRRQGGLGPAQALVANRDGKRYMDDLRAVLNEMDRQERARLAERATEVDAVSRAVRTTIIVATIVALLFVLGVGWYLTHTLNHQIGAAVGQVQSSSSELQVSSHQQAIGAREMATAMSEISTTISELLATSRQITESARQVAQIAQDTGRAAGVGETTVEDAQRSITSISRQVELIVTHMLDLGRKSQQIGAVLDIVSELAEQTNILAINATIEAAGAGETGRRFAVVADEIRKLSDRVGGSAKEVRTLIDEVRSAVNATVMTTETGAKTVSAGARQFEHVTTAFNQIARLVETTTEAGREIELSTKQQMTAVEQVNIAINSVAQASKESEVSSDQTQQTASQLATLSRDLLRLIQTPANA